MEVEMTRQETLAALVASLREIRAGAEHAGFADKHGMPCETKMAVLEGITFWYIDDGTETYFRVQSEDHRPLMTGYIDTPNGKQLPGVHVMSWKRGTWEATALRHAPAAR